MMNIYSQSPSAAVDNTSTIRFSIFKKLVMLFCLAISNVAFAQVISTNPGSFNYGTGDVSANPSGGTATFSTVGNDVTVTGSGTILTGSTTTSGIYNFHNFTVNAGVVLTVSGTSPL